MDTHNLCSWFTGILCFRSSNTPEILEIKPIYASNYKDAIKPRRDEKIPSTIPAQRPKSRFYTTFVSDGNVPSADVADMLKESRKHKLRTSKTSPSTNIYVDINEIAEENTNLSGFQIELKRITHKPELELELDPVPKVLSVLTKADCSEVLQEISKTLEDLDPEFQQIVNTVNAISDEKDKKTQKRSSKRTQPAVLVTEATRQSSYVPKIDLYTTKTSQQPFPVMETAPLTPKDEVPFILCESDWYKSLSPMRKRLVDRQISIVTKELNRFHTNSSANKCIDLTLLAQNVLLQQGLCNSGYYISDAGILEQIPKILRKPGFIQQHENDLLCTPSVLPIETADSLQLCPGLGAIPSDISTRCVENDAFPAQSDRTTVAQIEHYDMDESATASIGCFFDDTDSERLRIKALKKGAGNINFNFRDFEPPKPRKTATLVPKNLFRTILNDFDCDDGKDDENLV